MALIEITDPANDRYATLNLISWWDQDRLRNARVMVVGAGALGNEVLKNLALLGVGHVFLIDFDTVEAANLTRSVLFRMGDAGRRKVDAAAAGVRDINPDVEIAGFHGDVTKDIGLGVYRRMDVVLGCLDNRGARFAVNRACQRMGVPWIDGGMDVLMGTARVFVPGKGACYECTMTEQDYDLMNLRYSCPLLRPEDVDQGRFPTTPTTASIIAALQVQEAVRLLHGMDVPAGSGIYFNGHTRSMSTLSYARRADCCSHERYSPVIELDVASAELTVGGLLDLVAERVGGRVTLLLDFEVVASLFCPACKVRRPAWVPFEEAVPARVPCPACGGNRLPQVTNRLSAVPGSADVPLSQIGIRLLDVLIGESAGTRLFFELSGDAAAVHERWGKQ